MLATRPGETGGDTLTMTLGWSYLSASILSSWALVVLVIAQIVAKRFNRWP